MTPALDIKDLTVELNSKKILEGVTFSVDKQSWCMLVGPNGAGKSTCVYALAKTLLYTGNIQLFGKDIYEFNNTEYAKKIGFLSQKNLVAFDFSVEEIVSMGRYCHRQGYFGGLSKADKDKINEALQATGLFDIRGRSVQELSGGEVQRTFLAQVFAQDPEVLVLDEPTNNLDLVYQEQIFNLLNKWVKEKKRAIISVVHDIALAKYYGTKAVLLDKGTTASCGEINKVLTATNLNKVYGMNVKNYFNKLYKSF